MILKDYQQRALTTVRKYLEVLAEARKQAAEILKMDSTHDWARSAWEKCASDRVVASPTCLPRKNGMGEPLPTLCLKIPTGGGKTLLATKVVDLVNSYYRKRQTGLVLWIVPTTQIYNQTLRALKDCDHPYRQQLDVASAGTNGDSRKNQRIRPSGCRRELVRASAYAAVGQPRLEGAAPHVSGQWRLHSVLPLR